MERPFLLLLALRGRRDAPSLNAFVASLVEPVTAMARGCADPDELVQTTLIRVAERWDTCRAANPGELRGWVRQIVRRRRIDLAGPARSPDDTPLEHLPAGPATDPEHRATNRARGEAFEVAVEASLALDLGSLPPSDQAWARAHRVAKDPEVRRRGVDVLIAVRREEESYAAVAERLGIEIPAAHKAAQRAVPAIALGAYRRWLQGVDSALVRDGLLEIAARGGRLTTEPDDP